MTSSLFVYFQLLAEREAELEAEKEIKKTLAEAVEAEKSKFTAEVQRREKAEAELEAEKESNKAVAEAVLAEKSKLAQLGEQLKKVKRGGSRVSRPFVS